MHTIYFTNDLSETAKLKDLLIVVGKWKDQEALVRFHAKICWAIYLGQGPTQIRLDYYNFCSRKQFCLVSWYFCFTFACHLMSLTNHINVDIWNSLHIDS